MHILAIIGSPRKKGNTYQVTKTVEEILKQQKDVTFEYLFLSETNLGSCIGCHSCIFNDEATCPLDDDRDKILEKMKQADGIIFAAPVYVLSVPAVMKNFMDHFAFLCHRPIFFSKYGMVIATTGGWGEKKVITYMKQIISSWGMQIVSSIGMQTPPMEPVGTIIEKNKKKIQKATDRFAQAVQSGKPPKVSLFSIIQYRIFQKLILDYPEAFEADVRFYEPLRNSGFYTDTPLPVYKKAIAFIFEKIFIRK
jgi:multimeric flavodoxin WrbA